MILKSFSTTTFNLPTSIYLKAVVGRFLSRYWVYIALPVLLFLVLGLVVDLRFIVVAWMVPCVIYPMFMLMGYYNVMLRQQMRLLAFDRRVTYVNGESLTVTPVPTDEDDPRPLPDSLTIGERHLTDIHTTGSRLRFVIDKEAGVDLQFIDVPIDNIIFQD